MAINKAQKLVKDTGDLEVPIHLRNAPTALMKEIGYGKTYKYAHDFDGNFINQEFLPEEIANTKLFEPGTNQREASQKSYLREKWKDKYGY